MLATTAQALWLEELQVRSCSPNTLTVYRIHTDEALKEIARFLEKKVGSLRLEDITRDSIVAALSAYRSRPDKRSGKKRDRSASSVGRHLGAVKSFLSWCVQTEKLGRNPAMSIRAPKLPKRVPKALSLDACKALLEAAGRSRWPARDRLLVLCGMALGLRLSEITSLSLASFSPSVKDPQFVTVLGKGSKERSIPVPSSVRTALAAYLVERQAKLSLMGASTSALFLSLRLHGGSVEATRDGIGQTFERILIAASVKAPGLRVHTTRHSFATSALSSEAFNLEEIRTLLGHSSLAITQQYLHVDPHRLSAGSEKHPLACLEIPEPASPLEQAAVPAARPLSGTA